MTAAETLAPAPAAPDWLELLRAAVELWGMRGAAAKADMSHGPVSLVLAGKYPASTRKIEARVLARLAQDPLVLAAVARRAAARDAVPDWLAVLRAEVARVGVMATARALGISHASVSSAARGRYPAGTDRLAARVLAMLTTHHCPHLDAPIGGAACARWVTREVPTSIAADLKHWCACRKCPHGHAIQPEGHPTLRPARAAPVRGSRRKPGARHTV